MTQPSSNSASSAAHRAKVARAIALGIVAVSTGIEIGAGAYALYWLLKQRRTNDISAGGSELASLWALVIPIPLVAR
jgi:hypothetical protein